MLRIILLTLLLNQWVFSPSLAQADEATPDPNTKLEQLKHKHSIKLEDTKESDAFERKRKELQESEKRALEFIFPSIALEQDEKIKTEKYFSETEREQLLDLWRATIARNRTIQFIVRVLSTNPDEFEKNNAVMQVISKALFVPFYAVSAITSNALVSGGSAVGARVIGDVVDDVNHKSSRTREITHTELIVLFMLVDQVAERLRTHYFSYKEAKIEKELLHRELIPARLDAAEAIQAKLKESTFFTRMVVRDLERRSRANDIKYRTSRRTLVEMAGEQSVGSVDAMIDVEVKALINDITV